MKRVGIIGAKSMGRYHAARWARLPVDLVGFFDRHPDRGQAAADQFGVTAFTSQDALLGAVDVVVVTTPTYMHHQVVLDAAAAGKDIFCEKPMARHLDECQEMIQACQASGSRLFIGQVVRFFPQFARAKVVLDSGAIGRPGVIRTTRGGTHPTSSAWYAEPAKSGGVILDLAVHDLDYVRWCCGDVERVFANGLMGSGLPLTDYALITLRFTSGVIGHIEASWAFPPGSFITKLEIAGEEGLIEFDSEAGAPLRRRMGEEPGKAAGLTMPESPLAPEDDPYLREDEHFLNCLESDAEFAITPQDGMEAVRIALAAIQSTRTGRPVDVGSFKEEAAL